MKYSLLKQINIILQTLNVPIGVYSGIMLATGNTKMFTLGIAINMSMAFIQAHIWWKTMEQIDEVKKC